MKKFITAVPLQAISADLSTIAYQSVGNARLDLDRAVSFPILTAVGGYVQSGEDFRVLALGPDSDAAKRNREVLSGQLDALCRDKGLVCSRGVEPVLLEPGEDVGAHTQTFLKLLDYVEDDDELFCCMTFGTKPLAYTMVLAMQYAYRVKRNASMSCIVYGEVDRSGPKPWNTGKVYDMTALIQLDEVVHALAARNVADPRGALDTILSL